MRVRSVSPPLAVLAALVFAPASGAAKPFGDSWYEFRFHGKKVGFMHAVDERSTVEGQPALHSNRRSVVRVRRQSHRISIDATTSAWAHPDGRPIKFTHTRAESGATRQVEGFVEGKSIVLRMEVGGNLTRKTFPLARHTYFSSNLDAVFKRELAVGKKLSGKVLVEEDGELRDFALRVVEKKGAHFIVESKVGEVVSIEKVTPAGVTVETNVPRLGAQFLRVPREKALHFEQMEDIFSAARLATGVRLPPAVDLDEVVVRLESSTGHVPTPVQGEAQRVVRRAKNAVVVRMRVGEPPRRATRFPVKRKALARFLGETPYEAVTDERIVTRARQLVEGTTSSWDAARKINAFVFGHIKDKSLAKAYSSANEALSSGEGDCTEHAVLFSALAKSIGIPTRLITGLVYVGGADGVFGYHQWVEVWLGRGRGWLAMDPTFGQDIADPTHLKFTQGLSDPDGLHDAGIAAAELFSGIDMSVIEYTTSAGKRVKLK